MTNLIDRMRIERKALELANEVCVERSWNTHASLPRDNCSRTEALCRAIERHEAFRQEVSDALKGQFIGGIPDKVARFIITKPDPLVEVLADMGLKSKGGYDWASEFRATLAARGLEIVEKSK